MRAVLGLAVLSILISACSVLEGPHPWPNERRLLAKDWVRPQVEADQAPVYCYRTLGTVSCHDEPLPDSEAGRLVSTDEGVVRREAGDE